MFSVFSKFNVGSSVTCSVLAFVSSNVFCTGAAAASLGAFCSRVAAVVRVLTGVSSTGS